MIIKLINSTIGFCDKKNTLERLPGSRGKFAKNNIHYSNKPRQKKTKKAVEQQ
jgi:hypothetical protein